MPSYKYKCDILVDQHRYIGEDPVGYSCSGDVVKEDDNGRLWCQRCLDMLFGGEAHRLTIPNKQPYGKAAQDRVIKNFKEGMG